jgi:hypothetical protein
MSGILVLLFNYLFSPNKYRNYDIHYLGFKETSRVPTAKINNGSQSGPLIMYFVTIFQT